MILLDTHVLLWLDSADPRLGTESRAAIDEAYRAGELAVSAISFWETAMLIEKGASNSIYQLTYGVRICYRQGFAKSP